MGRDDGIGQAGREGFSQTGVGKDEVKQEDKEKIDNLEYVLRTQEEHGQHTKERKGQHS